jgi:putative flippase GtrA
MKSLIKFVVVGLTNTGIDILIFTLLVFLEIPVLPAQFVSYSCGIINSYFLNKFWTFHEKERPNLKQPIKFIFINMLTLGVVTLLLNEFYHHLEYSLLVSKLMSSSVGVLINYCGSRLWVFKRINTA